MKVVKYKGEKVRVELEDIGGWTQILIPSTQQVISVKTNKLEITDYPAISNTGSQKGSQNE